MATIKSTDDNFENLIKENKIILTDFWASWCKPCINIAPILEELSEELKDKGVVIAKHNIDQEPNTPTKYGIRGIPTMLLFKGGELKATKVGATTKSNIISWIKENIQFAFKNFPTKYKLPKTTIVFLFLSEHCFKAELKFGEVSVM